LITALETRPEEDLTKELVKNKLLEEYTRRKETAVSQPDVEQKALKTRDTRTPAVPVRIQQLRVSFVRNQTT